MENEKNLNIEKEMVEKKESKKKNIVIISVLIIAIGVLIYFFTGNMRMYNKAEKLVAAQKYIEAKQIYTELDDYKESEKMVLECDYQMALVYVQNKDYDSARVVFENLKEKGYRDSAEMVQLCNYEKAQLYIKAQEYVDALKYLEPLSENHYEDSEELYKECSYELGKKYLNEKDYANAITYLKDIDFKDSKELVDKLVNGENSLNKFIERYNKAVDVVQKVAPIKKLDINDFSDNQIPTGMGALLKFNEASENDCTYGVEQCMWYLKGWILANEDYITSEWACLTSAINPDISPEEALDVIVEAMESAGDGFGAYGSTTRGKYQFTVSKTKAVLTYAGSIEN